MEAIARFNQMKAQCKKSKQQIKQRHSGVIDETWSEIKLDGFLADNPNLISDLKRKYNI